MTDISPNNGTATLAVGPDQARVELSTWLRHERERSGLSIEAVSQETRISKTYILSLESGKLESLPGKVFGRGFVKNITRLLKTDTSEGLRLYDACWGAPISPVTENQNDGGASTEVHKTKSVKARIAEPINVSSPVTQRMMTVDFPQTGEKPRLPNKPLARKVRASVRMPAWLVRGAVSPHIRLWILAGIATVFVGLVFGRWAAGTLHKTRLDARLGKTNSLTVGASSLSKSITANADMAAIDQEKAMAEVAKATSALSDADRMPSVPKTDSLPASPIKALASVDTKQTVAGRGSIIAVDEDNPLYMPSTGAAFEQVLEFKVASDTEIRVILDGKKVEKTRFEAESYRFTFNDRAEIYIMDASNVDLIYNGKSLGVLGNKGRKRRIFLQAKASSGDFPQ